MLPAPTPLGSRVTRSREARRPVTVPRGSAYTGSSGTLWLIDPGIRSNQAASNTPSTDAPNRAATAAANTQNRASMMLPAAVGHSLVTRPSSILESGCSPCPLLMTVAGLHRECT